MIGVIGIGFVGDALKYSFTRKQISLKLYDKYKNGGIGKLEDVLDTKIVFLCLPTPYCKEKQTYLMDSIIEVCQFLSEHQYQGVVVIKSTVTPGTCEMLEKKYNLPIVHNPEFLTARTAQEDFHQQKHIVLGGESNQVVKDFYQKYYPEASISLASTKETESMKLFVNSFYAIKVQVFNEFYLLSQKLECDYQVIKEMMLQNGWINPMHTNVPGPDGQLSYGGACFPKDTQALLSFMKDVETPCLVLDSCVAERNTMRND